MVYRKILDRLLCLAYDDEERESKRRFKHKMLILHALDHVNNATCEEIENMLHLSHQSISARISELFKNGKIIDTGKRRKTSRGKNARVYELANN